MLFSQVPRLTTSSMPSTAPIAPTTVATTRPKTLLTLIRMAVDMKVGTRSYALP